jgi:ribonuclease P protein component
MTVPTRRIRNTFGRHERLHGVQRFRALMREGRTVLVPPFRLHGMPMELPGTAPVQVAFAVPKRLLPEAPRRNRMKRLMREAWRLNKAGLTERLSTAGGRVALLFVFQGRAPVTLAETSLKITRAVDRWLAQGTTAHQPSRRSDG